MTVGIFLLLSNATNEGSTVINSYTMQEYIEFISNYDKKQFWFLLILTFTNAAAHEMKERIRNAISKIPQLKEQLDYIDNSFITTFDTFLATIAKFLFIVPV